MIACLHRHWRLTLDVAYYGDSTLLRLLMGWASVAWGASMAIDGALFDRNIMRYMVVLVEWPVSLLAQYVPWFRLTAWLTPQEVWGLCFVVYGALSLWRIYEGRPRLVIGRLVAFLGFALWFLSTLAMTIAVGHYSLAFTVEWLVTLQLLLVAVRTALNDEMSSP